MLFNKKNIIQKNVLIFFKKMFILLLTNIANGSNNIKCVSLSNQKCLVQPTLINLHRG